MTTTHEVDTAHPSVGPSDLSHRAAEIIEVIATEARKPFDAEERALRLAFELRETFFGLTQRWCEGD